MTKSRIKLKLTANRLLGRFAGPIMGGLIYPLRFRNLADPNKPIWIKPDMIAGWYPGSRFKEMSFPGRIKGGDWHRRTRPAELVLARSTKVRSTIIRYKQNVEWVDTPLFRQRYEKRLNNKEFNECIRRYDQYDVLFDSLRNEGFKTFQEGFAPMFAHIGPSGEFYWTSDGNHRLGMAIALNSAIPVQILTRHLGWQLVRERIAAGEEQMTEAFSCHPDISNTIDDA